MSTIKTWTSPIRSRQGLTLVELMVSVGIVAITTFTAGSLWTIYSKNLQKFNSIIDTQIETTLAERVIYSDIRAAELSFHVLQMPGDTTSLASQNFFDLAKDLRCVCTNQTGTSCASWQWNYEGTTGNCERSFRLVPKTATASKTFYLLVEDRQAGAAFPFYVAEAYNATPPVSPGQAGALTYQGLARTRGTLGGTRPLDETAKMVNGGVAFWGPSAKKLVLLNVPLPLRALRADGTIDAGSFPRMASFLGKPSGDDLLPISSPSSSLVLGGEHPLSRTAATNFPSVDQFFRRMPLLAGIAAQVLVRAVTLVKYEINDNGDLMRSEFDPTSNAANPFLPAVKLAASVDYVQFSRQVNESAIRFVVKLKRKQQ